MTTVLSSRRSPEVALHEIRQTDDGPSLTSRSHVLVMPRASPDHAQRVASTRAARSGALGDLLAWDERLMLI
ncbi:hypothetical protein SAMD00023353_7100390 [Rosellinia necatrix]|uniref:Uncharacterized protein n=1 Tax=Rosellinia necatrix TaxID=77044 RepID=A0A1S8ABP5_ROSNE|nr:hypothetical protein SAMD00023353_7100390 [Rosellinia necatrix]